MHAVFPRHCHAHLPTAVRGEGAYLYDAQGKRYLDGCGGASVSNLGHSHPEVLAAIEQQLRQLPFAHTGFFTTEAAEQLAQGLLARAPFPQGRVYLGSGGSEAMETALKMAYQYHRECGRPEKRLFITRQQSYHGNTLGVLSVGGNLWRKQPYAPILSDSHHVSACYEYRDRGADESPTAYGQRLAAELEAKILDLGSDQVAAFIAETVGGATAGVLPPVPGYLQQVQAVCQRHGVLLILDEVMCGLLRCGDFYACDRDQGVPDMIALAKGLSGGYMPLSALVVKPEIYQAFAAGSGLFQHGHTFMAHPSACAAGATVVDILSQPAMQTQVNALSRQLFQALRRDLNAFPWVGDIRGRGLFVGIELVADRQSKTPLPAQLGIDKAIKAAAMDAGLMCYPGAGTIDGRQGHHILLAPPFILTPAQINELVDKLAHSLTQVHRQLATKVAAALGE